MHFGDEHHEKNNRLVVGIYTQTDLSSGDVYPELTSIQECVLFNPRSLQQFMRYADDNELDYLFPELKTCTPETWYVVTITDGSFAKLTITSIVEATTDAMRIH